MEDLLDGWGLSLAAFLPLAGAVVLMLIPKAAETLIKVVALATSLVVFAIGIGVAAYFDYDDSRTLQFVVDKPWIDVINSRYIVGIDGISLPLLAADAVHRAAGASSTRGTTSPSRTTPRPSWP